MIITQGYWIFLLYKYEVYAFSNLETVKHRWKYIHKFQTTSFKTYAKHTKKRKHEKKTQSVSTLPEAQIFSASHTSINLLEGRDWLECKNVKILFNFHQILSKTSSRQISFMVVW